MMIATVFLLKPTERRVCNAFLPTQLIRDTKRWVKNPAHPTKLAEQQLVGLKYE